MSTPNDEMMSRMMSQMETVTLAQSRAVGTLDTENKALLTRNEQLLEDNAALRIKTEAHAAEMEKLRGAKATLHTVNVANGKKIDKLRAQHAVKAEAFAEEMAMLRKEFAAYRKEHKNCKIEAEGVAETTTNPQQLFEISED
ncbi:hypothetical protein BDV95DRAFT_624395 [Massariosphaeria phaeospora]|uniref:Uncharacterized protein n=1 Tax=Massariosphaeria phaeospora TaxID=100035 RepID=A0A7C8I207_9PLEO|nr:hypothetical protein BDV95DRAFT_624395 [Massariosphaeria phaeospora]